MFRRTVIGLFASLVLLSNLTYAQCSHQEVINKLGEAAGWIFLAEGRHAEAIGEANDSELLRIQIPVILIRAENANCPGIEDLWDRYNDLSSQLSNLQLDLAGFQDTLDGLNEQYDELLEILQAWPTLNESERAQLCSDVGLLKAATVIAYEEALDLYVDAQQLRNAFQTLLDDANDADCTVSPLPIPIF